MSLLPSAEVAAYDRVYLSPHLDDAALSCGAQLLTDSAEGRRTLVVTLFTEPADGRATEESAAMALLGADHVLGGLVDAPARSPFYQRYSRVLFGRDPGDARVRERAAALVRGILDRARPAVFHAPLGVGLHVDHALTHEAACEAARDFRGLDVAFYEDRPYCFSPESVRLRLASLGAASAVLGLPRRSLPTVGARYLAGLAREPWIRSLVGPRDVAVTARGLLRLARQAVSEPVREAQAEVVTWDGQILERLREVVAAYRSQVRPVLGGLDRWERASRAYGAALGHAGGHAERRWRLTSP